MPRSPAEQAIYQSERKYYDAAARLEKALGILSALNSCITPRLPVEAAETHLTDTENHLDILRAKLADALAEMSRDIERRQEAEAARYAEAA